MLPHPIPTETLETNCLQASSSHCCYGGSTSRLRTRGSAEMMDGEKARREVRKEGGGREGSASSSSRARALSPLLILPRAFCAQRGRGNMMLPFGGVDCPLQRSLENVKELMNK